jgi:hypothetical protein
MSKRDWVVELIAQIVHKAPTGTHVQTAELIVDRLMEEGLLHLGHGDAEVDLIVDKFADTFGTTRTSRYDRFAARRLGVKYGSQAVCGIIQLLGEHRTDKYAPLVGSVTQLEEKWVSVLNFLRKLRRDEVIDA